jgi:hypothetical protein
MRACCSKLEIVLCDIVNEKPVRFDVAFPKTQICPAQTMRTTPCWEWLISDQELKDYGQFLWIKPTLEHAFIVALESTGLNDLAHGKMVSC